VAGRQYNLLLKRQACFDDEPFTGLISGYTGNIENAQIQIDIPKVKRKDT
jgi:hypothetical protein